MISQTWSLVVSDASFLEVGKLLLLVELISLLRFLQYDNSDHHKKSFRILTPSIHSFFKKPEIRWMNCVISRKLNLVLFTANGYSCLEKLATEKCKHKANQPEKKNLKNWRFYVRFIMKSWYRNNFYKKQFFIWMFVWKFI